MKLSLKLLHAELNNEYPGTEYRQVSSTVPQLSSASIISPTLSPADEVVYVHVPFVSIPRNLGEACVITDAQHAQYFPRSNLIIVPDEVNLLDVPAFVAAVFSRYFNWSDSLYEAIARGDDLQTLIDLTVPMIKQPMYFADASWKMLAYWGGDMVYVNPIWSYQMKFAYLPYHVYQDIIDAGDMKTYRDTDEVMYCAHRPGFGDLPFLSKAIRKEGKHYGNYFIISLYRDLDARDYEVAEHLGNVVGTALYGDSDYLEASSLYSSHFIIDVIEGSLDSLSLMSDQLHALKWEYEGDFGLSVISLEHNDTALASHIMLLANSAGLDVNSFLYQGNIVSVFNSFSCNREQTEQRLAALARDFNTTVAIGNAFSKFNDVRAAYLQDIFLLDHARKNKMRSVLLKFSEHYLDYLAYSTQETASMRAPIERLREHDIEHNTEYCPTLYYWLLHERNTVKTASLLYVHRNTLKNRLSNIESILGLDLEDPEIRLQLSVGLHQLCTYDIQEDLVHASELQAESESESE